MGAQATHSDSKTAPACAGSEERDCFQNESQRPVQYDFRGIGILILIMGVMAIWFVSPTAAGSPLPPRPTLTPTPTSSSGGRDRVVGAYIALHVAGAPANAWSVVQWQDSAGGWHDVGGWRGALDVAGGQRWWVASKDFGTGPFRWSVTENRNGPIWGVSQEFRLPAEAGTTVTVTLR